MEKIKIKNASGDKDFFTIVPNLILDNSNAVELALYIQIKRYAGDGGRCFMTEQTLCKKLGIGKKAYWKARDRLIEKGWITFIGLTSSKTRPIKTYKVNNVWGENTEHHKTKKISAERNISSKSEKDKCQKKHKISARRDAYQDPIRNQDLKDLAAQDAAAVNIQPLIDLFKHINPSYTRIFSNKTERASLLRLVKQYSYEKVERMICALPGIITKPYAPRITTPYQLERDMGKLVAFVAQEKNKPSISNKIAF